MKAVLVNLEGENQHFELPDEPFSQSADLSKNAQVVLERRYLKRDRDGKPTEKPEDMFRRVAITVALTDKNYDKDADVAATAARFYQRMIKSEFLPNSPTLMNAGRHLGQLSACFVLPVEDSMEGIFEAVKRAALIHKSGGGTGFSFSRIRPQNDVVHSTTGISSGPISFMKVFDIATETVKQGGTRRGANMAILRIDHPDIMDFITVKRDLSVLTNFNISVALTEEFMKAVEKGSDYHLVNPRNGKDAGMLDAREVFETIVESAWSSGEPGIIFLDRINAANPTPNVGEIESTNPCGEQPLLPYESCNLGSINLSKMVRDGKVDYDALRETVRDAVHFLDNIIDINNFPLEQIAEMTRGNRKIGLGVMGFADMLFKLGVAYDSDEAVALAEKVMGVIQSEGHKMSQELAEQRGAFPNFKGSIYDRPGAPPMRNATITTIAPTGTISIIGGCSSGVEPLFGLAYERNVMDGTHLIEVHPLFEEELKKRGLDNDELMKKIVARGAVRGMKEISEALQRIFVTAHDVTPKWHIRIQAAFQKYTDNAVSKTVNFPKSATKNDVAEVFQLAYKLGCKGVTIYRDGSRESQVLTVGTEKEKQSQQQFISRREMRIRPDMTRGYTYKVRTGCGNLYVSVNEDEHGICEVFSHLGKTGGCAAAQAEATSRLVSLALRSGVEPEQIIKQLQNIQCPKAVWYKGHKILSCPDAIGWALKWHLDATHTEELKLPLEIPHNGSENKKSSSDVPQSGSSEGVAVGSCPECGATLYKAEGCEMCPVCGYSRCD